MKTKEILVEIDNLREKEGILEKIIDNAVYNYLDDYIGVKSVITSASDDIIGKAIYGQWHWYWNREMNLITICYCVFTNKWGSFSDEKEININYSVIDKYIKI